MPSTGSRSSWSPDGPTVAAVRERLVDGEVEPFVASAPAGAVERAAPSDERGATAAGQRQAGRARRPFGRAAAPRGRRRPPRAFAPARRGAAVAAGLLAPALDASTRPSPRACLEHRVTSCEQLGRARVRLRRRPADDATLAPRAKSASRELGAHVLRSRRARSWVRRGAARSCGRAPRRRRCRCSCTSFSMCRW